MAMSVCAKGCCGIWLIFLGVFWLLWISVCWKKVNLYYAYTTSTIYEEVNFGNILRYPVVTICNLNPVRLSSFSSSDLFNAGQLYGILDDKMQLVDSLADFDNLKEKLEFTKEDTEKLFNLEEFQRRTGHKIDDILKLCKFRNSPCSSRNFTTILTDMGLCYQFNSNGKKLAFNAGSAHGLNLFLATQQDDYLPPRSDDPTAGWGAAGYKVLVHDREVPPLVSDFGIEISSGLKASIGVEEEWVSTMRPPYGNSICGEGGSRVQNYSIYSVEACIMECKTQHIMEECGCRMPYMPRIPSSGHRNSVCSPQKVVSCAEERLTRLEVGDVCGVYSCPNYCMTTRYRTSVSVTKLAESLPGGLVSNDVAALSVYFQRLSLKRLAQYPSYTLASLLGDIGYSFSLLLAASVLTILEIRRKKQ